MILFKAKTPSGKWVEGLPIYLTEYAKDFSEIDGIQCCLTRDNYDVIPETVCQLKAIVKGNKIFVGDKVLVKGSKRSLKYETFVIEHRFGGGALNENRTIFTDQSALQAVIKVIGNIHD